MTHTSRETGGDRTSVHTAHCSTYSPPRTCECPGAHHKVAQLVAADQHLRGGLLQDLGAAHTPSARCSHQKRGSLEPGRHSELVTAQGTTTRLCPLLLGERAVVFAQPDLPLPAEEQEEMNLRGAASRRGKRAGAKLVRTHTRGRCAGARVEGCSCTPFQQHRAATKRFEDAPWRRSRAERNPSAPQTGCALTHAVLQPTTTQYSARPAALVAESRQARFWRGRSRLLT